MSTPNTPKLEHYVNLIPAPPRKPSKRRPSRAARAGQLRIVALTLHVVMTGLSVGLTVWGATHNVEGTLIGATVAMCKVGFAFTEPAYKQFTGGPSAPLPDAPDAGEAEDAG